MGANKSDKNDIKLPPMKCELNFLSKSDGSAILAQGETVTLASVNGPLEIKMANQNIEKATLEVLFNSKGGKPSVADRYKENIIRQTCETALLGMLYPRTGITVTVQELEDYGGLVSCCVNSICLALLNCGAGMRCAVAGVTCGLRGGEVLLAPRGDVTATMTFVFDSREKTLVTGFTEGSFSEDTYREALEKCKAASDVIFAFYREVVSNYSSVIGGPS